MVSFIYVSKKGNEKFGSSSCLGEPDLGMEVDDDFISEQVSVCFVLYECYYAYTLYKIATLFHIQCLYSIDPLTLEVCVMQIKTRLAIMEKTHREILDALLLIQKNQKLILENLFQKP